MAYAQHIQVIQTFAAHGFLEALAYRIGVGRVYRSFEHLDASACSRSGKLNTIFAVVITNQILGAFAKGSGLAELLGSPGVGWAGGYPIVNHSSGGQFNDGKHE